MLARSMEKMMLIGSASPQFSMGKVVSKSSCVIFSKMFFNLMMSSLVKLSCIQSNMMSMLISMMNSLPVLWSMMRALMMKRMYSMKPKMLLKAAVLLNDVHLELEDDHDVILISPLSFKVVMRKLRMTKLQGWN